jgi:hypothetical protein
VAAQPEKSDRQHAKEAGVSHPTIAKARKKAAATGKSFPVGGKRKGADGRTRRTRRPSVATDAEGRKWKFSLWHDEGGWTWRAETKDGEHYGLNGGHTIDREGAREEAIDKIKSYRGEASAGETSGDAADQEPAGKPESGALDKGRELGAAKGETNSFERWQKQAAEAALATAPGAKPTRAEILTADRWWAVLLADKDIAGARQIHALLVDDERRTAVTETLGQAIDAAGKGREALFKVMADALGVTASDTNGANDNDEDPTRSADRMRAKFAAMDDEPSGEWQIKTKKYQKGWWWSASNNNRTLSCPTDLGVLFATEDEAEAGARAAIKKEVTK